MKPHIRSLVTLLTLLAAVLTGATAQTPRLMSYQGVLTDSKGNPKDDGRYSVTFSLYDADVNGTALWTETDSVDLK